MSSCNQNACETQRTAGSCSGEAQSEGCCLPQVDCPVEKSVSTWQGSFFQAMKDVQVDILKDRIRKGWGAQMEKVGDAVVEALGTHWQALLAQARAQAKLREDIKTIYEKSAK